MSQNDQSQPQKSFKVPSLGASLFPPSSNRMPVPSLNIPSAGNLTALSPSQKIMSSQGEKAGTKFKVALTPGHSPMDWARLSTSLAKHKKPYRNVTKTELAKHNKKHDCWMAYENIVYDITKYVEFHPGGVEEILRGKGRDGTNLFNEVHSWVNLRNMLKNCIVGQLVNDPDPGAVTFEVQENGLKIILNCNPIMAFYDKRKSKIHLYDEDLIRIKTIDISPKFDNFWSKIEFTKFNEILLTGETQAGLENQDFKIIYEKPVHLEYHDILLKDTVIIDEKQNLKIYDFVVPNMVPFGNEFNEDFKSSYSTSPSSSNFLQIPHISLKNPQNSERPYSIISSNINKSKLARLDDENSDFNFKLLIKIYKDGVFTKNFENYLGQSGKITATLVSLTNNLDSWVWVVF